MLDAAIVETHAGHMTTVDEHLTHFAVQVNFSADILEQLHHRIDNRPGAANREPNSPFALQVIYEGINAGCIEGVAAHQ